jgi:hypothetical protein
MNEWRKKEEERSQKNPKLQIPKSQLLSRFHAIRAAKIRAAK